MTTYSISSMECAPKDRRIVAYGRHAHQAMLGWATVRWSNPHNGFICDPNEATEYDYEVSSCSVWFDLPQDGVLPAHDALNVPSSQDDTQ